MGENAEKIRELEEQIAELKGAEPRPLTPAEVRAMSPEEAAERWEAVKATIAIATASEGPAPSATERLRLGYAQADDPDQVRRERRNK